MSREKFLGKDSSVNPQWETLPAAGEMSDWVLREYLEGVPQHPSWCTTQIHLTRIISSHHLRTAPPEFQLVSFTGRNGQKEVQRCTIQPQLLQLVSVLCKQANKTKQNPTTPRSSFSTSHSRFIVSSANTSSGKLAYTVKSPSPSLGVVFSECLLHFSIYLSKLGKGLLTSILVDFCMPNVFFSASIILQLTLMIRINYSTRLVTLLLACQSFWHKKPQRLGRIRSLKFNGILVISPGGSKTYKCTESGVVAQEAHIFPSKSLGMMVSGPLLLLSLVPLTHIF